MEKKINLQVEPRTVRGKKVRFLRREGKIPASVYGPGMESIAVQVDEKELKRVLRAAGQHHLVHLTVGSKKKVHQVLVRDVQRNSMTDELLHVDLYQLPLDKKFTSQVLLTLAGEAPVISAGGVLLHVLDHVTIECLPKDLPSTIEVDITGLEALDAEIRARDLIPPPNVKILTDDDVLIVKIQKSRILRMAEEEAAAAALGLVDEDGMPIEGEGEEPAEGE